MKALHCSGRVVPIFVLALCVAWATPSARALTGREPGVSAQAANAQVGAQANATIDAATRDEVIEGALKALNLDYVFPETAAKMEQAIRERMRRKEYEGVNSAAAFASTLTAHLQEVSKDKHLRVIYNDGSRPMFGGGPDPAERERARAFAAKRNFGFEKVERLAGNIGYLDLRGFEDPSLALDTAAAAMNFLANTDAMIVDLRQNGGGNPETVAFICSYLFDKRTHLNDLYERRADKTQEFWTRENVPGKRYGDKPVYILTSRRTFSAAEEFTYNLKNLKRATVIGETTGGGAHPVNARPLGKQFLITVPFARAINPITKTNWEGVGVKPDVETSAESALKVAHLAALKATLPNTTDQTLAGQLKSLIENLQKEVGDIAIPAAPKTTAQSISNSASQSATTKETAAGADVNESVKLPDTAAGKSLGEFIKAFNSGDLETMKRFHREHGGNEENAQQDLGFFQQTGGLRIQSVSRSDQFEIEVLTQARNGDRWQSFAIGVDPNAPHGIVEIRVRPAAAPTEKIRDSGNSTTPGKEKVNDAGLVEKLNALIDNRVKDDSFSGVVMVARNNKPFFQRAVGLANKSAALPNRIDTKFNLGSINKIFTRVAITQLIEQGKLSFEDTIGKHLPEYPNKDAAAKVTIKQLLEMQSGIGDFFGPKFEATPKSRIRSINDYLPLFADQPLKFEPGTSRAYSNGGYIVLGAIIEKVTGQSYYDYVRERIFQPAGMNNTDAYESDANIPNLAEGYLNKEKGERASNIDTRPARGSSAGGGYSTVEDLLKFTIALQNNKLLSPENSRRIGGGLGIAGGAPGINAALEFNSHSGYTIIVLSNYGPPSAESVSEEIRRWVESMRA
jgi:CubicO group peptidase (beta-lactamase class C family)